jgi:DNA-binding transcriptional MerR regulator
VAELKEFEPSKFVSKRLGIAPRTLDSWIREGVTTTRIPAAGTGTSRMFDWNDVLMVALVQRLTKAGIGLSTVTKALKEAREHLSDGANKLIIYATKDEPLIGWLAMGDNDLKPLLDWIMEHSDDFQVIEVKALTIVDMGQLRSQVASLVADEEVKTDGNSETAAQ